MKKIITEIVFFAITIILMFIPIKIYDWYTKYNNRGKMIAVLTKKINLDNIIIQEISNIQCKCLSKKEADKIHKLHQYKNDAIEINIELAKISSDINL